MYTCAADVVLHRDALVANLAAEVNDLKAQLTVCNDKLVAHGVPMAPAVDIATTPLQLVQVGKGKRRCHYSAEAHLSMAVRRNVANVGGGRFGACVLAQVSRHQLYRSELRLAACIIMSCRNFFAEMQNSQPALSIMSITSDATNSSCWQQAKLINARVTSAFLPSCSQLLSGKQFLDETYHKTCWADPQRVDNASGEGTYALLKKQLTNLGMPMWTEDLTAPADFLDGDTLRTYLERQLPAVDDGVRLRFTVSDGGGDQVRHRRIVRHVTRFRLNEIDIDGNCLMHAAQLTYRSGLALAAGVRMCSHGPSRSANNRPHANRHEAQRLSEEARLPLRLAWWHGGPEAFWGQGAWECNRGGPTAPGRSMDIWAQAC